MPSLKRIAKVAESLDSRPELLLHKLREARVESPSARLKARRSKARS